MSDAVWNPGLPWRATLNEDKKFDLDACAERLRVELAVESESLPERIAKLLDVLSGRPLKDGNIQDE